MEQKCIYLCRFSQLFVMSAFSLHTILQSNDLLDLFIQLYIMSAFSLLTYILYVCITIQWFVGLCHPALYNVCFFPTYFITIQWFVGLVHPALHNVRFFPTYLHTLCMYYNPMICWTLSSTLNDTASVSICWNSAEWVLSLQKCAFKVIKSRSFLMI